MTRSTETTTPRSPDLECLIDNTRPFLARLRDALPAARAILLSGLPMTNHCTALDETIEASFPVATRKAIDDCYDTLMKLPAGDAIDVEDVRYETFNRAVLLGADEALILGVALGLLLDPAVLAVDQQPSVGRPS